jgi:tRNA(adenine34) deaminase
MPKPQPRPDEYFMQQALREACQALQAGEVPVGAVVVHQGQIIGRGYNRVESRQDATQHAELIAIRQAARRQGGWRLEGCQLFVTLEPCAMCAGAITWSRVARVVYAAADPKAGACGSVLQVLGNPRLNHRPRIEAGLLALESSKLLQGFFRRLRRSRTNRKKTNK